MPACSAFGCTNRTDKKVPGSTFHRFPAKIEQRQAWILACRRKDWMPTKTSSLCSIHFSEDQIDRTGLLKVRLRENAVPNIFPGFPPHLQNARKARKKPATSTTTSEITPREITPLKSEELMLENDDTITSSPACSDESEIGNQSAMLVKSTNSAPAVIRTRIKSHSDAAVSPKKDHKIENLRHKLQKLEGTIFKCYKIIKEPASSNICITSETTIKKFTMSKDGKFVLENGDIVTFLPVCFPASEESALENQVAKSTDSVPDVEKSYRDASTLAIDPENVLLKQKLKKLEDRIVQCHKKIKVLHQANRRAKEQAMKYKYLFEELVDEEYYAHEDYKLPIEIVLPNSTSPNKECLKQQKRKLENENHTNNTLSEIESEKDLTPTHSHI